MFSIKIANKLLKRRLKKVLLAVIIAIILLISLTHFIFRGQFQELNVLVQKYTNLNINQNTGIHKFLLRVIEKATFILPKINYLEVKRDANDIGVGVYDPSNFYLKNQITHKIFVENETEIVHALSVAKPGTEIIIKPGNYKFKGRGIAINVSGEVYAPIVLKSLKVGTVVFNLGTSEGLMINKPFIRVENIVFKGNKGADSWINHAIHITGNANYTSIVNNEFINFNAQIKSNGEINKQGKRVFPNYVHIKHNNFYNEWKRNTTQSVNSIDVVGGNNWLIEDNFIADFGQNGRKGKGVTTGAYLKGAGKNGIFQHNLVACEWKLPYTNANDIRIGLSFGGGGTGPQFCMDKQCKYEHDFGIMRGNTIVNCLNDVSIYLNKSSNTKIYNNILYNSVGIDVRYPASSALIYDNIINGRIKARDGASVKEYDNDWIN